METKVKLVGVKIPVDLVSNLEDVAKRQYKNISTLIREIIADYIEDDLTLREWRLIEKGRKEYRKGKYTPWRDVIHG